MTLRLFIGNKNYSSWSMRPWVLLKQSGIAFTEEMLRFDGFGQDSEFKKVIVKVSPVGKVPVLVDEDFSVWDSLAIAEYLADKFPEKNLWPKSSKNRARARSVCAEMHNGFAALRNACPMNIEANLSQVGQIIWRDQAAVRADIARITQMWSELLNAHQGPMLFGDFSIADAFYAPVAMRIQSYALPVGPQIEAYVQRLSALPGVKAWIDEAKSENDFIAFQEPYRAAR
jgi:glutathione S-transferase